MKSKSLIIILVLLFGTIVTHAQDKEKEKLFGIRGGWHSASMVEDGSKPDTVNSLNTFYVGFFRDNRISRIFYFGTGLEYFQNGMKYSNSSKRVLHTISIPLDLKVKIGPVFVLGGIAANFKVSEKIVVNDNSSKPSDGNKSNWFDAPAFLGAGVKIFFFSIEGRYHWGLINANDGLHNRYFQLGVAVSF